MLNSNNSCRFVIDISDRKHFQDSMLAASDNGRAQFVGINIDTFAIHLASSSSSAV